MSLTDWFTLFKPRFDPVPIREKIRSGLAVLAGILLLGLAMRLFTQIGYPVAMLASMAAAGVLLYAVPHSPMAQPWPLIGGNLVSGAVGWVCSLLIPDPVLASGCAVGAAVLIMHLLHCLHPPGGATAVIMVLGAEQFHQHSGLWAITVLVNVLLSLLLALAINNLLPGRRYPAWHVSAQSVVPRGVPETEDVEWALTQMDGVIDVSEEDLLEICCLAIARAKERRIMA